MKVYNSSEVWRDTVRFYGDVKVEPLFFAGLCSDLNLDRPEPPESWLPKITVGGQTWAEMNDWDAYCSAVAIKRWEAKATNDTKLLWKDTWCIIQEVVQYAEDVSHNTNSLETHAFAEYVKVKLPELRLMVLRVNWVEFSEYISRFVNAFTVEADKRTKALEAIANFFHHKLKRLYETR